MVCPRCSWVYKRFFCFLAVVVCGVPSELFFDKVLVFLVGVPGVRTILNLFPIGVPGAFPEIWQLIVLCFIGVPGARAT